MDFLENVNIEDIKEIYGEEYLELIKENIELVNENVKIMEKLNFTDIEGIFERYSDIFLNDSKYFENRFKEIIKNIGENYVEEIENDVSILEKI